MFAEYSSTYFLSVLVCDLFITWLDSNSYVRSIDKPDLTEIVLEKLGNKVEDFIAIEKGDVEGHSVND